MNAIYAGLLASSIVLIQFLIGGTRLVFSLKGYAILAIAALLTIITARRPTKAHLPCLAVSAAFFAYILIRAAFSPWDYLWWQDFYQVIACLIVYGITTLAMTTTTARMWVIGILMALCVAEFFFGLRQFRYLDNWMPFGFIRSDGGARASGSLISSIHFAGFMEAIAPFALALAFWSRWPGWARFLAGYTALLGYAGVAISGSRGAYLSSIFSLLVFAVLSFVTLRRVRPEKFLRAMIVALMATAALVTGGIVLMNQSPDLKRRLDLILKQDIKILQYAAAAGSGAKDEKPSIDIRIYNWQATLDHFRVSPVLGTGAGTHVYYGRLYRRPPLQSDPIHAHSDYLELLAEYGIIGAIGMLAFLVVHLRHGLQRWSGTIRAEMTDLASYEPARSNDAALLIGALTAVAAYLAHSVVDFNLHIPGNALFFAFIFGLLASPRADRGSNSERVELVFRWAIPALGVWMLLAGVTKYPGEHWCEQARIALRDRRYEESILLAEKALKSEKRNPDLYFHYGEAHRGLAAQAIRPDEAKKSLAAALEAYDRSLAIFPNDEHVLIRKAQALDAMGRFREARPLYEQAIAHDPNLGVLYRYFGQHLAKVGRFEEARAAFKKSRQFPAPPSKGVSVDPAFLDAPQEPAFPASE